MGVPFFEFEFSDRPRARCALSPTRSQAGPSSASRGKRAWVIGASTTLADLFTLRFRADPPSAVRASLRRTLSDKFDDGAAHGWQAWLRWWAVDSFFPASLF